MAHFEIEIKSLLGTEERAEELRNRLMSLPFPVKPKGKHSQLNHYFSGGDMTALETSVAPLLKEDDQKSLRKLLQEGKSHSIRTRQADGKVLLVVKASIDDTTSANGISRMECEVEFPDLTLDQLDQLLLEAGLEYQAKWSRDREEYEAGDITVCLDRNAGYGYVVEFERLVEDASEADATREALLSWMNSLGVEELPQDRLERMFAYYNANWREYYGTDKVFVVE